ncbi:MAG TPA: DUF4105 domain-containing protein [Bacteroidales bacterium]|nr:DUF4105 domain-containing protein [Bacteroidales bacterium]HOU95119.1 DUF4105 domain-containing protein [Bacteroidales bacterium]HQG36391.1 DUF4105 domain-containing protein [Bacteroidales bacterium]HQG53718.1 DUF4105 domain-containing protein [Bacteroidales bacterium]HQJ21099.1 DUF4105 domain-containing protein [Bacteroidales bacterium]
MKFRFILSALLIFTCLVNLRSQVVNDTSVYLITCSPGTETYSLYGHSAIRVAIPSAGIDVVYNWGVFDFNTKNFVWKFASGKLRYMLGVYPYNVFLEEYLIDKRSVYSQKVNMESEDLKYLMALLEENLKPENIFYLYDFFYDNCSTRIRDLFEKIYNGKLIYPPYENNEIPTFRQKLSEYHRNYPWLKLGIDFLLGLPADKKATFRDQMFLPLDLQRNLSQVVINRNRKMIPLLQNIETIFEFESMQQKPPFYSSPMLILIVIFVLILLVSVKFQNTLFIYYLDIALFAIFTILSILMIFFNFITDHEQTKLNLNIIWCNPFILLCLLSLALNKNGIIWFKIVFWLSIISILIALVFTGYTNIALVPAIMILAFKSGYRANFPWYPFNQVVLFNK